MCGWAVHIHTLYGDALLPPTHTQGMHIGGAPGTAAATPAALAVAPGLGGAAVAALAAASVVGVLVAAAGVWGGRCRGR